MKQKTQGESPILISILNLDSYIFLYILTYCEL